MRVLEVTFQHCDLTNVGKVSTWISQNPVIFSQVKWRTGQQLPDKLC